MRCLHLEDDALGTLLLSSALDLMLRYSLDSDYFDWFGSGYDRTGSFDTMTTSDRDWYWEVLHHN
jgi:hypothetical protein